MSKYRRTERVMEDLEWKDGRRKDSPWKCTVLSEYVNMHVKVKVKVKVSVVASLLTESSQKTRNILADASLLRQKTRELSIMELGLTAMAVYTDDEDAGRHMSRVMRGAAPVDMDFLSVYFIHMPDVAYLTFCGIGDKLGGGGAL